MKKIVCLFVLSACLVSAFAQNAVPMDTGLSKSVSFFEGRIAKGTKLALLNVKSSYEQLSEYVMEEMTAYFANANFFTVVERSHLELLRQEMNFQLSGEVSDETALSIGKMLGAQTIISGSIDLLGDVYRLRIRAIDVQSATIQGVYTANIQRDRILTSLTATPAQNTDSQPQPRQNTPPPPPRTGSGSGVALPDYLFN